MENVIITWAGGTNLFRDFHEVINFSAGLDKKIFSSYLFSVDKIQGPLWRLLY